MSGQDLCGWQGPQPGVACHLLANPMGRMEPRRELEKESCCGLVVLLWPEMMLCFSGRTRGQGPIRVMLLAGKAEGCITIQPVSITPTLYPGCRGMAKRSPEMPDLPWSGIHVHPDADISSLCPTFAHLQQSPQWPPPQGQFSAVFHSPEPCCIQG